jgi:hypothetical protein
MPFTGNIIPNARMYGPALAFMQYFPEPEPSGNEANYITDQNLNRPYRSYMVRSTITLTTTTASSVSSITVEIPRTGTT